MYEWVINNRMTSDERMYDLNLKIMNPKLIQRLRLCSQNFKSILWHTDTYLNSNNSISYS